MKTLLVKKEMAFGHWRERWTKSEAQNAAASSEGHSQWRGQVNKVQATLLATLFATLLATDLRLEPSLLERAELFIGLRSYLSKGKRRGQATWGR